MFVPVIRADQEEKLLSTAQALHIASWKRAKNKPGGSVVSLKTVVSIKSLVRVPLPRMVLTWYENNRRMDFSFRHFSFRPWGVDRRERGSSWNFLLQNSGPAFLKECVITKTSQQNVDVIAGHRKRKGLGSNKI
jgi:hypothetical protein